MSAPFVINRSVRFDDAPDDGPYLILDMGADGYRPHFVGTIPVSFLPRRPDDDDVSVLAGVFDGSASGGVEELFDMLTRLGPDLRMADAMRRIVNNMLDGLPDIPTAEDIVSNAGVQSEGERIDRENIVTDISTLLTGLTIPRDLDEALALIDDVSNYRDQIPTGGTSSFFGRRWNCTHTTPRADSDIMLRYHSNDESWAGPWRLNITAVYPPERMA